MNINFPNNPQHGMIFEASPGLFFQFDARINTWVRVDGLEALGLATPTTPGLMSPEDLKKIDGLILPPPQASLKAEDCPVTFRSGKIRLTSTDGSINVKPALDVINKIGGVKIGGEKSWTLHENTVGINFTLNVETLLEELKKNGNFTQVIIQGRQGPQGERGEDGIDELDTGPKGKTGAAGANSPYDGTITTETNAYQIADTSTNRAIVDIHTEETDNGKFLVATRANIGNPLACPREVQPKNISSPWGLVINHKNNIGLRKIESTNECNNPCTVCVSSLHYINLDHITSAIFERFKELVLELKKKKEELVAYWLRVMMTLFSEQKAAICCALENCRSAKRNAATRQFIDAQRIQAAQIQTSIPVAVPSGGSIKHVPLGGTGSAVGGSGGVGGMSLTIESGGGHHRQAIEMDPGKQCQNQIEAIIRRGTGCDCSVQYTLDAKLHATDPRSLNLPKPSGLVDTIQTGIFGADRQGILNTHQVIFKPRADAFTDDDEPASKHSRVVFSTGQKPPSQTKFANIWTVEIGNFSINSDVIKDGTVTVAVTLKQDGFIVGRFESNVPMADMPKQTLVLTPPPTIKFDQLADTNKDIDAQIDITATTTFGKLEALQAVVLDYTLGRVTLRGIGQIADISIILKDDWNEGGWTLDGVIIPNQGLGFIQFGLPAGDYVAEIIDCCANTSRAINEYTGLTGIEYNAIVGTDGTVERQTVFFPDLGTFTDYADARAAYMGAKIKFSHAGGQIRSWIFDRDLHADNNEGNVTICIKPQKCFDEPSVAVPTEGAIFVYRGSINPNNLIGLIYPFTGSLTAAANYGYGNVTAGASIQYGPSPSAKITKSFFYNGIDGLSFFTIHGSSPSTTSIKMKIDVINNNSTVGIKVADDPSEFMSPAPNTFSGNWSVGQYQTDGFAIGSLDDAASGTWAITVNPNDFGSHEIWQAVSSDGNTFDLLVDANGIGTSANNQPIIFTPISSGCIMSYKQIHWLERGHRIGAACSAVVNIGGQDYIVVRRSIGNDMTCGGGESMANPCVAQYIQAGQGHPAIAWPTLNGEEFSGIPTSGYHGFIFDQTLSDQVVAKLKAGDMTNVNGDPANNISIVLFPAAQ
ncbi:MAG: hypothetical protein QXU32_01945 [Nitrososphaerales archaeon]